MVISGATGTHFNIEARAGLARPLDPPAMKELRFGIIGTGWPGQQHAIALAAIPNVRMRSCADSNSERLRTFVETYHPENSFDDYSQLLGDRELDAAIICLPNFLH